MLSGSGAPTAATGITGDTYVDNVTGFVYSKATGSWVSTGQSLKGPTGAAGATGPQGPAGTNG
ncbi:MAG: collagen-like protein, partial [Cloacibacterium sp.]|nr:collagen-like protein [Cloacibacterium sp.]